MMKSNLLACVLVLGLCACDLQIGTGLGSEPDSRIVDHSFTPLKDLSAADILNAKEKLHIMYGHTSHGSQLTDGMQGLITFANNNGAGMSFAQNIFSFANGGGEGRLDYREGDGYGDGDMDHDAGYWPAWLNETTAYLGDPNSEGRGTNHPEINVIMWSWCGQVSSRTQETMLSTYLQPMRQLETDYPGVTFVYMTGHLDGSGLTGNLHLRNEQIRAFCRANNCWLYDFAGIETYNPDGTYYGDRIPNDECNYDSNGDGIRDANWAENWQNTHTQNVDWYSCGAAHSVALNANRKAYAAWNLFVRIAKEY